MYRVNSYLIETSHEMVVIYQNLVNKFLLYHKLQGFFFYYYFLKFKIIDLHLYKRGIVFETVHVVFT